MTRDMTTAAATDPVDALVIFGATGDLAKLETFPALVGLVDRGVLDVPVIGVAKSGWGLDQFRDYAAASLTLNGMDPDDAGRQDDAQPAALRRRRPRRPGHLRRDVRRDRHRHAGHLFYLEVPPPLFGRIAEGIAGGRTRRGRPGHGGEALRHRPGQRAAAERRRCTRSSPRTRSTGSTTGSDSTRWTTCSSRGSPTRSSSHCSTATHVESIQITMAEAFDVADRGRFYDRTGAIRDVVQNHMLQVLASVLADPPNGAGVDSWLDAKTRVIDALRPLTPADTVRGQYEGYHDVAGVDPDSTTETYVAVRLALRLVALGRRADRHPGRQDHARHRHRGQDPVPPPAARRLRRQRPGR